MPAEYLTIQQAARRWGVSRQLVYRWIYQRRVVGWKLGGFWLIPSDTRRPEPLRIRRRRSGKAG